MSKYYKNIGLIFVLMIPITFLGFYKGYFSKFPSFRERHDIYTHLHAVFSIIWILLLIIQPTLIKNKNYSLHRKIGKFSYLVFGLIVFTFFTMLNKSYARGGWQGIFFPSIDVILLVTFFSLAMIHRKTVALHMRYMISTAFVFLNPTLGRVLGIYFHNEYFDTAHILYGGINLTLILLIINDIKNGNNYKPYLVALVGIAIYYSLHLMIFTFGLF